MSQRGASRWAYGNRGAQNTEDAWSVRWTDPDQILTHYYTGVHIRDVATKSVLSKPDRWVPLQIDWGPTDRQPPAMQAGTAYPISVQVQNTGVSTWTCNPSSSLTYQLGYRWLHTYRDLDRVTTEEQTSPNRAAVCELAPGAAQMVNMTIAGMPGDWGTGTITLRFDIYKTTSNGSTKFSDSGGWPEYSQPIRHCPATGCTRQARAFDLAFVIDTTGSMGDDLDAVQASATQIVNSIAASGDDYRVAVIDFRDFPSAPYGGTSDYPARVALDFSTDQSAIINTINGLTIGWGNDTPEAVYSGLMAGVNLPWRADAEKVIILMGDAPPHDPEPNTSYTSDSVIAAANAGGTPMQSGFAAMALAASTTATNGTPIGIHPIMIGGDTDALAAFQQLADGTGGTLFEASSAADVSGAVLDAINTTIQSPTADVGGPYQAAIGESITFDGLDSFDPDGIITSYEWDFDGDGVFDSVSTEPTATYTYTAAFSGSVTLRVTDNSGLSAIAMAQVDVPGTTVTPTLTRTATATPTMTPTPPGTAAGVLDDFNRANGAIGAAWIGATSSYQIATNQLAITGGDAAIFWATPFGADQEVSVTLSTVDTASTEIDLLLKAQDSSRCNVLEVWYQPARETVEVWTCTGTGTWVQHGSGLAASFTAGDRLGARVTASGIVTVLKNGTSLGSITVASSWPYLNQGGMIGLWGIDGTNRFDDFAGGTLSGGSPTNTPTPTSTPTTPAPTHTPTSTPTTPTYTPTTTPSSVLDNFNRTNGVIGPAWVGETDAFQIDTNQLKAVDDGAIGWGTPFGAAQHVNVTLSSIDSTSEEIDLLLRAQDDSGCNLIEVWYQPANNRVQVWSCDSSNGWVQHGSNIAVTFANGDRFGAQVSASGVVTVFKNETSIGSATVGSSWPYLYQGGSIGLWSIGGANRFDDFAGGTVSSGAVPRRGPAVAAAAGGRAYLSAGQNGE